ncbi:MAG: hypothetical protein GXO90_04160, partial [FCB group bacterium]|nr:hypothetical protein [FCB group bacterium]
MIQRWTGLVLFAGMSLYGTIPVSSWNVVVRSGYDSNVLRLSAVEETQSAVDPALLGRMQTFDSAYLRLGGSVVSEYRLKKDNQAIRQKIVLYRTNYLQSPDRAYTSGQWTLDYSWGPYRHVRLKLGLLKDFYLRNYLDRDISSTDQAACFFTDLDHQINVSFPVARRTWIQLDGGQLQRYYPAPFAEFSLDIRYAGFRFSKDFHRKWKTSAILRYSQAKNLTFGRTARAGDFDRSYNAVEMTLPVTLRIRDSILREIGVSQKTEWRYYIVEDFQDPLHSGRNHRDVQWNLWGRSRISDNLSLKLNLRYRTRNTDSKYTWVRDLKSFRQFQTWIE